MARDFRRLQTLAEEVLKQCRHYERNTAAGHNDDIRGLMVGTEAHEIGAIGARMERRWRRQKKQREESVSTPEAPGVPERGLR